MLTESYKSDLVKETKHKANQSTDEVRLGNRNHGLAWSQSGNSDNKTVQTLLSLLKTYNQGRKYAHIFFWKTPAGIYWVTIHSP